MYEVQFQTTNSADWAEALELIDANTNMALDVPDDAVFELAIGDRCWSGDFRASSEDGAITRPADNIIQWQFTREQLNRFWAPGTYRVGITMKTSGGTTQLLVGTLSIINGVV